MQWSSVRPVILEQQVLEYKYAIFSKQSPPVFQRWENIESNRSITLERKPPPALVAPLRWSANAPFSCRCAAAHPHLQTTDTLGDVASSKGPAASSASPALVRSLSQRASQLMSASESPTSAGEDVQLAHTDGVIIVGNLLPVNISKVVVDGHVSPQALPRPA